MVVFKRGNILDETDADALVNPVNCVGVMGAGLALQFRKRYPEMFQSYREACEASKMHVGRMWVYKANGQFPRYIIKNLSFSNLQWKVANANQALLDRFAGFAGLTYDEWAALEDSEDKWLFYLLCYNGYFPNAASYADCKSNSESMMDALNYLGSNPTAIPDGVVINDTSVYAIPGTLWMSNPEHFGQGAVNVIGFYDIDAGLFSRVPDGAKLALIHGGIVGVTAENADMVINKLPTLLTRL